jgi:outer membrane protein assembly factor BamB
VSADVTTPAFYDGDFFVLNEGRKKLSRIEPQTGKAKWSVPMPGPRKYEASPLAADGKIYSVDFTGRVAIHDARDGKLLRTIDMDQPANGEVVRSSIVAAGGRHYIRTTRALYCIGK